MLPHILLSPENPWLLYVLAHGAGAGMRHSFMQETAERLHSLGIASLRYEFPYMASGGRRPDPPAVLERTVQTAIEMAAQLLPGVPIIAGGKSMGGRMTSQLLAKDPGLAVRGVAFLGFPLHYPKQPARTRAQHLFDVVHPMLFVQGTRDTLADFDLMKQVVGELGPRATLHVVEGGDHSFAVLKRSGRTADMVMTEIAHAIGSWSQALLHIQQKI